MLRNLFQIINNNLQIFGKNKINSSIQLAYNILDPCLMDGTHINQAKAFKFAQLYMKISCSQTKNKKEIRVHHRKMKKLYHTTQQIISKIISLYQIKQSQIEYARNRFTNLIFSLQKSVRLKLRRKIKRPKLNKNTIEYIQQQVEQNMLNRQLNQQINNKINNKINQQKILPKNNFLQNNNFKAQFVNNKDQIQFSQNQLISNNIQLIDSQNCENQVIQQKYIYGSNIIQQKVYRHQDRSSDMLIQQQHEIATQQKQSNKKNMKEIVEEKQQFLQINTPIKQLTSQTKVNRLIKQNQRIQIYKNIQKSQNIKSDIISYYETKHGYIDSKIYSPQIINKKTKQLTKQQKIRIQMQHLYKNFSNLSKGKYDRFLSQQKWSKQQNIKYISYLKYHKNKFIQINSNMKRVNFNEMLQYLAPINTKKLQQRNSHAQLYRRSLQKTLQQLQKYFQLTQQQINQGINHLQRYEQNKKRKLLLQKGITIPQLQQNIQIQQKKQLKKQQLKKCLIQKLFTLPKFKIKINKQKLIDQLTDQKQKKISHLKQNNIDTTGQQYRVSSTHLQKVSFFIRFAYTKQQFNYMKQQIKLKINQLLKQKFSSKIQKTQNMSQNIQSTQQKLHQFNQNINQKIQRQINPENFQLQDEIKVNKQFKRQLKNNEIKFYSQQICDKIKSNKTHKEGIKKKEIKQILKSQVRQIIQQKKMKNDDEDTKNANYEQWTQMQNLLFVSYLKLNKGIFRQWDAKNQRGTFVEMSQLVNTKTSRQLYVKFTRQKVNYKSIQQMIDGLIEKYYFDPDEVASIVKKLRQKQQQRIQNAFYRTINMKGETIYIQVDTQQLRNNPNPPPIQGKLIIQNRISF